MRRSSEGHRVLARVTVDIELSYESGDRDTVDWAIHRALDQAAMAAPGCELLSAAVTIDPF